MKYVPRSQNALNDLLRETERATFPAFERIHVLSVPHAAFDSSVATPASQNGHFQFQGHGQGHQYQTQQQNQSQSQNQSNPNRNRLSRRAKNVKSYDETFDALGTDIDESSLNLQSQIASNGIGNIPVLSQNLPNLPNLLSNSVSDVRMTESPSLMPLALPLPTSLSRPLSQSLPQTLSQSLSLSQAQILSQTRSQSHPYPLVGAHPQPLPQPHTQPQVLAQLKAHSQSMLQTSGSPTLSAHVVSSPKDSTSSPSMLLHQQHLLQIQKLQQQRQQLQHHQKQQQLQQQLQLQHVYRQQQQQELQSHLSSQPQGLVKSQQQQQQQVNPSSAYPAQNMSPYLPSPMLSSSQLPHATSIASIATPSTSSESLNLIDPNIGSSSVIPQRQLQPQFQLIIVSFNSTWGEKLSFKTNVPLKTQWATFKAKIMEDLRHYGEYNGDLDLFCAGRRLDLGEFVGQSLTSLVSTSFFFLAPPRPLRAKIVMFLLTIHIKKPPQRSANFTITATIPLVACSVQILPNTDPVTVTVNLSVTADQVKTLVDPKQILWPPSAFSLVRDGNVLDGRLQLSKMPLGNQKGFYFTIQATQNVNPQLQSAKVKGIL